MTFFRIFYGLLLIALMSICDDLLGRSDGHVHLKSENKQSETEFVSLTTASAVKNMIIAWWDEFNREHITSISQRAVKFNSFFKANTNKPSLRPYLSVDDSFSLIIQQNQLLPSSGFQLLLRSSNLQSLTYFT